MVAKEFFNWRSYPDWKKKALLGCSALLVWAGSLLIFSNISLINPNLNYAVAYLHALTVVLFYFWNGSIWDKRKFGFCMTVVILTFSAVHPILVSLLIFPILLQSWIKSRSLVASWNISALYYKEEPHPYLFFALMKKALPKRLPFIFGIINPFWWALYIYAYIYASKTGGYVIDEDGEIHALIEIRINILGAEFREGTLTIAEIGQRTTDTKNTLLGPALVVNPGLKLNVARAIDSGEQIDAIDYMFLRPGSKIFQEVNRYKREHS